VSALDLLGHRLFALLQHQHINLLCAHGYASLMLNLKCGSEKLYKASMWRRSLRMLHTTQVKGKRLDTDTGIRTRSRAAAQQEQFEAVPAPVQMFILLADMLIEAREGLTHHLHGTDCAF